MGDALAKFASVMSRGKWTPGNTSDQNPAQDKASKKEEANKPQTRTFIRDVSPELQAALNPGGKLSPNLQDWWTDLLSHLPRCEIKVEVQASAKTWAKIDKNVVLENHFGQLTHERVQEAIQPLSSALLRILQTTDADIAPLSDPQDAKAQANINKKWAKCQEECSAKIVEFQAKIGAGVMEEIKTVFTELKETKESVQTYRFVAGARVFKGVVLIAGNIAHAAASWGATSPLAIVLIVRESIEIAQIVGKGLADADDLAKLVEFDLKTIQTFYTDAEGGKAQNNTAEVISGIASGVLAIEIPNVKNCKIHIKDFEHKVNQIKIDHVKMGEKLVKLASKVGELHGKIEAAKAAGAVKLHKKLSNQQVIKGLEELRTNFGRIHDELFDEVPKVVEIIKGYNELADGWKETLAGYDKQTSGWTKHASTLAAFATEAGMGMGHVGGEHVETAAELATQHLKIGLEAGTIVMSALSDKALEILGD